MLRYAFLSLLVVAADQAAKAWARTLTEPVTLLPGVLGLRYTVNTGMAFSMLSGHAWLLGLMSLAVIVAGVLLLRRYRLGPLSRTAAALMLGGAAGNMLDRLFLGYVTDMVEVLLFRFAVFNVADAALCVGCALMAASLIFCKGEWESK